MYRCWLRVVRLGLAVGVGTPGFWVPATGFTNGPPVITSVVQFWSVPPEVFAQGLPIQLEGTVLYEDPEWGLFFFQDETGPLFTPPPRQLAGAIAGDRIRLTGQTAWSQNDRRVNGMAVEVLGRGVLPTPVRLSLAELTNRMAAPQRVAVEGVVRLAEPLDGNRGRLVLDLGTTRLQAFVRQAAPEALVRIQHAQVQVVALRVPADRPMQGVAPVDLLVNGMADIQVLLAMSEDPFQAPLYSIGYVLRQFEVGRPPMLHRFRGVAEDHVVGRSFWLDDGTGRLLVRTSQILVLTNGTRVEVVGYPAGRGPEEVWLEEARYRLAGSGRESSQTRPNRVLRSVREIRALTPEQAGARWPVSLEAVVTYHDPHWRVLFVQQQDAGIFVQCPDPPGVLQPGDRVQIQGVTDPGGYAPIIDQGQITRLGPGPVPEAERPRLSQLFSGQLDSSWVELQVRIRTIRRLGQNLEMELISQRGGIVAWLPGWGDQPVPDNWVGLEVRARGVVGSRFNALRQLTGVTLHIPGLAFVEFLEPVPEDPWDREPTPIRHLLTATGGPANGTRVLIRGVVTYASTNGWVAVGDDTGGLWLHLSQPGLRPGQKVELMGFPTGGPHGPTLEHPLVRILGQDHLPSPVQATAQALISSELDAQRVTVEGTLVENQTYLPRPYLLLDDGGTLFHVYFADGSQQFTALPWKPGSRLAVTGVCQVQRDEWGRPRTVRIMTAGTADLRLLAAPPWMTRRHWMMGAGLTAMAAVTALAWGCTLRRKVQAQTRQLEQQFRIELELKKRYEDLFENAGDLILLLEADGRISAVNRAVETVFDQPRAGLLGRPLAEFLHPDDRPRLAEVVTQVRQGHACAPFEVRLQGHAGQERVLELHIQALQQDRSCTGFECIARDQTERRRLECQLRQMQRLESVGQLAAGVAHDYNNLMTVVLGHAGMLLHEGDLPPAVHESLQEIQRAASRAADLTRQLLAFSRKQVMQARPVNLNEVVTDMTKMLRRLIGEHIELRCQLDPAVSLVQADVAMIEQVIVNLAVNARDAMPNGGTLTIRTERVDVSPEHLQKSPESIPGRHVCLSVIDTGIGMDPETVRHIFEPFFTTKPFGKGSGLGLATVYGIVKQHNGWIEVESQLGRGSVFRVYLPALSGAREDRKSSEAGCMQGGRETVLAVEDEPALRLLLVNSLRRLGYHVLAAQDAHQALQLWQQHRDQIDLVITDMVMPGGVNGQELAARLRQDRPQLKVIFSSGYSQELFHEGLERLPGPFLPKPFTPSKLAQAVRTCLDGEPVARSWTSAQPEPTST